MTRALALMLRTAPARLTAAPAPILPSTRLGGTVLAATALLLAAPALALLLLAAPAWAGDTAPGAHLWPEEPDYAVSIPMGELPPCTALGDCCGVHRDCGDWHVQRHNVPVAQVPLPTTATALLLGLAGLGILKRKLT